MNKEWKLCLNEDGSGTCVPNEEYCSKKSEGCGPLMRWCNSTLSPEMGKCDFYNQHEEGFECEAYNFDQLVISANGSECKYFYR